MVVFELLVLVAGAVLMWYLRGKDAHWFRRFFIVFLGVLIFEYFTQPLWLNKNLEWWAYLYLDVSWVITVGWTVIIIVAEELVDYFKPGLSLKSKFFLYLLMVTAIGLMAEYLVLAIGIRGYAPAVLSILSGNKLFGLVPAEALYYIPVFMALVISFSKYWELTLQEPKSVPQKAVQRTSKPARRKR